MSPHALLDAMSDYPGLIQKFQSLIINTYYMRFRNINLCSYIYVCVRSVNNQDSLFVYIYIS
jgi:hypothetical protein